jgi:hypothetical protein
LAHGNSLQPQNVGVLHLRNASTTDTTAAAAAAAAAAAVHCNQASGLDVTKPEIAWTILAPTDYAFTDRLNKSLGITPAELLTPGNRPLLVQVGAQSYN